MSVFLEECFHDVRSFPVRNLIFNTHNSQINTYRIDIIMLIGSFFSIQSGWLLVLHSTIYHATFSASSQSEFELSAVHFIDVHVWLDSRHSRRFDLLIGITWVIYNTSMTRQAAPVVIETLWVAKWNNSRWFISKMSRWETSGLVEILDGWRGMAGRQQDILLSFC